MLSCVDHATRAARFECPGCKLPFCEGCARHEWTRRGFVDRCPRCPGVALHALPPHHVGRADRLAAAPPPGGRAFLARLPALLGFPFERPVLVLLVGLAAVAPLLGALWLFGSLTLVGLELGLYFYLVRQTSHGAEIDAPDFTDLGDVLGPIPLYLAALAPFLLAGVVFGLERGSLLAGLVAALGDPRLLASSPLATLLVALGILLLPVTTLIAVMSGSVLATLDPRRWVGALRALGDTYVAALVAFSLVLVVELFVLRPLLAIAISAVDVPYLGSAIAHLVLYVPLALRARILGALYQPFVGR